MKKAEMKNKTKAGKIICSWCIRDLREIMEYVVGPKFHFEQCDKY